MKNFLLAFVVFLVWSFFGLWLYSWLGEDASSRSLSKHSPAESSQFASEIYTDDATSLNDKLQNEDISSEGISTSSEIEIDTQHEDPKTQVKMRVYDEFGDTLFVFENGIPVEMNSATIKIPKNSLDFKYKIASYLAEHPNKEVVIRSSYSANEEFESPNYGIQRGEAIKKILIDAGINAERIVVKPVIKVLDFKNSRVVKNGFSFVLKPLDESRLVKLKDEIPEARVFYPMYKGTDIQVNEELTSLAMEAKEVFMLHPDVKLKIIGHTEKEGTREDSYRKALKYAQQIKWYIVSKGNLNGSRVLVRSVGASEAMAYNGQQAKSNNNRIELIYLQE